METTTILDRALADARQQGMDEQTIATLRDNVKDGLLAVHQRESGDFIWRTFGRTDNCEDEG